MVQEQLQIFGGDWTQQKLEMLQKYLQAYTTALKNQWFSIAYVDAFAGTGYVEIAARSEGEAMLFDEIANEEPQRFLDGSARIALNVSPSFHKYFFVEAHKGRFSELEKLREAFPDKADKIILHHGDANAFLRHYCSDTDWRRWRAVVFLDPYGMQVEWETLIAIARTQSIDVWILFPLGIAVNRLLARNPEKIATAWKERLTRMFGSVDWFDAFYRESCTEELLGTRKQVQKICTPDIISSYFYGKLDSIFARVADNPRTLRNSTGTPLFQVFFAAGNPRGADIAVRIAQHILKEQQ